MKRFACFCIVLLCAGFFVACNDDDPNPSPSIDLQIESISHEANSLQVRFKATSNWTTEKGSASWVQIAPENGKAGSSTINITATNEANDTRTAEIIIRCNNTSKTVSFTQVSRDILVAAEKNYNIDAEGGDINIKFGHNVNFEIDIEDDWIVLKKTRAYMEEDLNFTIKPNPVTDPREGRIIFKSKDGNLAQFVTVKQAAKVLTHLPIPDPLFKKWLVQNFDQDKDGEISFSEAEAITSISIGQDNQGYNTYGAFITSIEGIEYMPNLELFSFEACDWDNYRDNFMGKLKHADFSRNLKLKELSITYCPLDKLDVSMLKNLEKLNCQTNRLEELDVTQNTKLQYLFCGMENLLTKLDVSKNTELLQLSCGLDGTGRMFVSDYPQGRDIMRGNLLTEIDLSNNPKLELFDCVSNKIEKLVINNNPKLKAILCYANLLTIMEISNTPELTYLEFGVSAPFPTWCGNYLTNIDLTNMPKLENLKCSANRLEVLDLTNNPVLRELICDGNNLTTLDVSKNPLLRTLLFDFNQLTEIDLSKNPEMDWFNCADNKLTKVDFSHNPMLTSINCNHNQITSINVADHAYLNSIDCEGNKLTELITSGCKDLFMVYCRNNQLTELDFSSNPKIDIFKTMGNPDLKTIWIPMGFDITKHESCEIDNWTRLCEKDQTTAMSHLNTERRALISHHQQPEFIFGQDRFK